jgi:D-glycerate 3-kinase
MSLLAKLTDPRTLDAVAAQIERRLPGVKTRPLVVGLCGAQGSGKSTLAKALARHFSDRSISTTIISIDDLYYTRRERDALAQQVHPLMRTRGVPGTHDVALGLAVFASIDAGAATSLPRFDKATDDRLPPTDWHTAPADTRLVIFEGWCVGAQPQPISALAEPINELERVEDSDGRWRRHVNAELTGNYQLLFDRIDLQVLLAAPDFETVFGWRIEQERTLQAQTGHSMTDDAVIRFVRHYERLTRHILAEMPKRADLLVQLDESRVPVSLRP